MLPPPMEPLAPSSPIPTLDLSTATLLDALIALPESGDRGVIFYDAKGRQRRVSYAELWARSLRFAGGLRRAGLRVGDPVALVLPDPEGRIIAILGPKAAGCPPAPTYPPFPPPAR